MFNPFLASSDAMGGFAALADFVHRKRCGCSSSGTVRIVAAIINAAAAREYQSLKASDPRPDPVSQRHGEEVIRKSLRQSL